MTRALCLILFACTGTAAELEVTAAHRAYWAYQPLTNPALPNVKDTAWVRTPVDTFILAALEAKGLKPAPAASARAASSARDSSARALSRL